MTFNLPIGRDGQVPEATIAQMQRMGRALGAERASSVSRPQANQ